MLMLSTISKCFSLLTTLLTSINLLARVEGDALVFNQMEGAFVVRLLHLFFPFWESSVFFIFA